MGETLSKPSGPTYPITYAPGASREGKVCVRRRRPTRARAPPHPPRELAFHSRAAPARARRAPKPFDAAQL